MIAAAGNIVAQHIDLLERYALRQHREQLRIEAELREVQMQQIERSSPGAKAGRLRSDVEDLCVAEREAVQGKQLVAVHRDRAAVEQREANIIVQRGGT